MSGDAKPGAVTVQDVIGAMREMSPDMFADAIREGTDKLLADKLPAIEALARAAERRRILEICERIKEPHRQPGTGSLEYAVPLVLLRAELVPKAGSSS
jgi:hypothetical protein